MYIDGLTGHGNVCMSDGQMEKLPGLIRRLDTEMSVCQMGRRKAAGTYEMV